MYLCANCREDFPQKMGTCSACGWILREHDGIPMYLSDTDRLDPLFQDYLENYQQLATADLETTIMDKTYLSNQADKMLTYASGQWSSILEVGVGQGFLLRRLRPKYPDARIVAVDISMPFLQHLRSTIDVNCMVANAENLPFSDEFELLLASDILEHVLNPIDFLLSANFALRENGTLVMRVPFEDNMLQYSRLLGSKYKFAHLRNFSKRNLSLLLKQSGFRVDSWRFDGWYAYQRRSFFTKGRAKKWFERYIQKYFPNENDVAKIPNWLGYIFMRPMEVIVVATKCRLVSSMNYPV